MLTFRYLSKYNLKIMITINMIAKKKKEKNLTYSPYLFSYVYESIFFFLLLLIIILVDWLSSILINFSIHMTSFCSSLDSSYNYNTVTITLLSHRYSISVSFIVSSMRTKSRLFINSFAYSRIHSFIHSLTHSLTQLSTIRKICKTAFFSNFRSYSNTQCFVFLVPRKIILTNGTCFRLSPYWVFLFALFLFSHILYVHMT